jgi:hypothetical protein
MPDKSKTEYLGKVSGNNKKSANVHTIKDSELMILVPTVSQENTISLRVKLD